MSASAITAAKAFVEVGVKGVKESSQQLASMMGGLKGMAGKIGLDTKDIAAATKFTAALGAVGVAFNVVVGAGKAALQTIQFFTKGIEESMERVSGIVKMADRLGTSIGFASQLRVIAEDSNMSLNEMEQSMAAFQRNVHTASMGIGESYKTMKQIGLDPQKLANQDLETSIMEVTAALSTIPGQMDRGGAAMRIFGEQGRKLLPILGGNVDVFKALQEQSNFLGTTYDEEGARSVDNLRDSWKKLGMQLQGIWDQFTMAVAPALLQIIDGGIIPFIHVMQELIGLIDDGGMGVDAFGESFSWVTLIVKSLTAVIVGLMNESAKVFSFLIGVAKDLVKAYATAKEGFGFDASGANAAAKQLEGYQNAIDLTTGKVSKYMRNFEENFAKAQSEWADLVQKERDNTAKGIGEPAEEIAESVQELSNVFKGEALQRNASTMQRLQEMSLQNTKDIKEYVKKIHQSFSSATIVMGTL